MVPGRAPASGQPRVKEGQTFTPASALEDLVDLVPGAVTSSTVIPRKNDVVATVVSEEHVGSTCAES